MDISLIKKELELFASLERSLQNRYFFKTGKGEYGEGDLFLGVSVGDIRKVTKKFSSEITIENAKELLFSPYHEVRFAGALFFVLLYQKAVKGGDVKSIKNIIKEYREQGSKFNNWDLVDTSASSVLGEYLVCFAAEEERRDIFKQLIQSNNLWDNRIAVVAIHSFSKRQEHVQSFDVIEQSLFHSHNLIHKANGWMLREIGKYSGQEVLTTFLKKHAHHMPRTTLRYALEHYQKEERDYWMKIINEKVS